jgi:hypothetical protein
MKRFGRNCAPLSGNAVLTGELMQTDFNHAANDSPRSGSSKKVTPVMWAVVVVVMVAVAIWFGLRV